MTKFEPLIAELARAPRPSIKRNAPSRRMRELLRGSDELLRQLVDNIREVFWISDVTKNHIFFVSPGYEVIWGRTCQSLYEAPRDWLEAIHPEDRQRVLQAALSKQILGEYDETYRLLHPDGTLRWIRDRAFPVRDQTGKVYRIVGIAEDITERKRTYAALQELASIVEDSEDAIMSITLEGLVVNWNKSAERIYGYKAEEIQSRPFTTLVMAERMKEFAEIMENLRRGHARRSFETRRRRKDGTMIDVSMTMSPVKDAAGKIIGASIISRDITERKRLEREIVEISVNERRRIGQELHDGLGQYLAGIAFRAKALEQTLAGEGSECAREAGELAGFINSAIHQARSLARGLDPVEVESSGLLTALRQLVGETQKFFGVTCALDCNIPTLRLGSQLSLALYRIAQEAIHNAIKHGQATRIEVKMAFEGDYLCLRIQDNGRGFNVGAVEQTGMGLRVMQYRARSVGAKLTISSRRAQGTQIQCAAPHLD